MPLSHRVVVELSHNYVISVKGKNMIRTRSTVVIDDVAVPVKPLKPVLGLRSGLKRSVSNIKMTKFKTKANKLQRAGLRSGGKIEEPKKVAKDSITSKVKKLTQVCYFTFPIFPNLKNTILARR